MAEYRFIHYPNIQQPIFCNYTEGTIIPTTVNDLNCERFGYVYIDSKEYNNRVLKQLERLVYSLDNILDTSRKEYNRILYTIKHLPNKDIACTIQPKTIMYGKYCCLDLSEEDLDEMYLDYYSYHSYIKEELLKTIQIFKKK